MRRRLSCKAYNFNVKNLLPFLPYILSSCVNVERGSSKKINREKSAISAVGISCPDKIMPASTAATSFFLSKSMFIRLRPVPFHRPFKNSMTLGSRSFLYSSMCAKAFAEAATVPLRAEIVEF